MFNSLTVAPLKLITRSDRGSRAALFSHQIPYQPLAHF
ncbi:hypothetical protein TcasGA2_TC031945 [Tribolium castaneum]|uniref:Uncharacterized protein n=1 Tax=Tribolium castaneum TaxID=7070 RepID=A0A139W8W3_TRICA|nr:hypothetical protein TcasGA2_TC031945 [Tribolium castaneum]